MPAFAGHTAPQISCTVITPPSLPAGIHGANHQESDAPPHAGALQCGDGMLTAAPATVEVTAGDLDLRPCGDDLHYNVAPMLAAGVANGSRSAALRSLSILAAACPRAVHKGRSPGESAPGFSAPSAPGGVCSGQAGVRKCCPGRGAETGICGQTEWLHATAGTSSALWGSRSHWHAGCGGCRVPSPQTHTRDG
jgi:hypothetical protein